jgi:hypothetical protein
VIAAIENSGANSKRGIVATALFPAFRTRFAIALLLTFFPYGLLYPLDYPIGELLTLCSWIWVFPSPVGRLALGIVPLIATEAYGYFAFNLFCLIANLSIAWSASRCADFDGFRISGLHRFARGCMVATLVIAAVQAITGPSIWVELFPRMLLTPGRGAGLKYEPSQLASLLSLYLVLLAVRVKNLDALHEPLTMRKSLLWEAIWAILATVAVARSISVLIAAACFGPVLFIRRKHAVLTVAAMLAAVLVAVSVLGDRIQAAIGDADGSMTDLITSSLGSWRNIPDIAIVSNYSAFLVPGNPAEIRVKINTSVALMSPVFAWLENTYSIFAAGGVTAGLLVTVIAFIAGMALGMKGLASSSPARISWLMMYLASWFILSKYDPSGWVVLGLLLLAPKLRRPEPEWSAPQVGEGLVPGIVET